MDNNDANEQEMSKQERSDQQDQESDITASLHYVLEKLAEIQQVNYYISQRQRSLNYSDQRKNNIPPNENRFRAILDAADNVYTEYKKMLEAELENLIVTHFPGAIYAWDKHLFPEIFPNEKIGESLKKKFGPEAKPPFLSPTEEPPF